MNLTLSRPVFWQIAVIAALAVSTSSRASGALLSRGNGMVYNDILDITLVVDPTYARTEFAANPGRIGEIIAAVGAVDGHTLIAADFVASTGRMSWWGAMAWVDQLTYGGFSDWRLTKADPAFRPDVFGHAVGGTTNELGQLYFDELGGIAGSGATGVSVQTLGDPDLAKFANLQDWVYRQTGHPAPSVPAGGSPDPTRAWDFHFGTFYRGWQFSFPKSNANFYALAVRDGDVVPEPPTVFLVVLAGLAAAVQRIATLTARHRGIA